MGTKITAEHIEANTETANYFHGYDTYGTPIEVAKRKEDGHFFWRSYRYNGYGMSWSKWQKHEPFEVLSRGDAPYIKWGWNELRGFVGKPRLPKI